MSTNERSLENLRRQYTRFGLNDGDLDPNPFRQFKLWFDEACDLDAGEDFEANAMALATANARGEVSNRIVLLKYFDENGFCFFTNYESHKGQDLEENPHAALLFYWAPLERQIRIEGTVERTDPELSREYFDSRPRLSRISAVISPQSRPVPDRKFLEEAARQELDKVGEGPIELPSYWGGYRLRPVRFEFWQGRENRLHDRVQYEKQGDSWKTVRLGP